MTLNEALHTLTDRGVADLLDFDLKFGDAFLDDELATALASLSGQLDDAETEDELVEAVRSGQSLFVAEVFTDDDVRAEVETVIAAVCQSVEADPRFSEAPE